MFILRSIKIGKNCEHRKNLVPGEYALVSEEFDKLPRNFYGENICVSAIVGKNGSGKSSVLDMIMRALNNVDAVTCTNLKAENSAAFSFVAGVDAEITYSTLTNKKRQNHTLRCCHDKILLDGADLSLGLASNKLSIGDVAKETFYCAVVNYSPFALNSSEYGKEFSVRIGTDLKPEANTDHEKLNWLQSIFHKNDGYQSNITILPYRNYGQLDASKESKLSKERILEILLMHPNFIKGYELGKVECRLNEDKFTDMFSLTKPTKENGFNPKMKIREFLDIFERVIYDSQKVSMASRILNELLPSDLRTGKSPLHTYCYLYLVQKVLNIAQYPKFSEYKDINDTNLAIEIGDNNQRKKAICLAKAVLTDHSHITAKIERVKNFLKIIDEFVEGDTIKETFNYGFYKKVLSDRTSQEQEPDSPASPLEVSRSLPPSFFDFEIFLKADGTGEEALFEKLSSGERQLYTVISGIVYHAMNLISALGDKDRVQYGNMLVVLDEVELCFHPDYQRVFVDRLLSTIKRLNFNRYMSFHFLLTTHSPFMLSDIPQCNILYLKDGEGIESKNMINPFCANINDILAQSFFLEKDGFIGEHAKNIVRSLHGFLSCKKSKDKIRWSKESAKKAIEAVGEPLIREALTYMYSEKYGEADYIRRRIEELQNRLDDIERQEK